jgi:hypothetical protein
LEEKEREGKAKNEETSGRSREVWEGRSLDGGLEGFGGFI